MPPAERGIKNSAIILLPCRPLTACQPHTRLQHTTTPASPYTRAHAAWHPGPVGVPPPPTGEQSLPRGHTSTDAATFAAHVTASHTSGSAGSHHRAAHGSRIHTRGSRYSQAPARTGAGRYLEHAATHAARTPATISSLHLHGYAARCSHTRGSHTHAIATLGTGPRP